MSKYFILDNVESFCQSGVYRKAKRHGMNHAFLKYLVTMNNRVIKHCELQAFFEKKDRKGIK